MPRYEKPGIYLEIAGVSASSKGSDGLLGYKHAYLVFRRHDGTAEIIRGGPDSPIVLGSDIKVDTRKSINQTLDRSRDGVERPAKRLEIPAEKAEEVWANMRGRAEQIGRGSVDYELPGPDEIPHFRRSPANSNAVVRAALIAGGIDPNEALPDGISLDELPGFERDIRHDDPQVPKQNDFDDNDTEHGFGPYAAVEPDLMNDDVANVTRTLPPDAAELRDALMPTESDDYGVDALMRKSVDDLTETEVQVLQDAAFDERDTETRHLINDRLQDFYRLTYGDGPAQYDETGKMIPPTPMRDVPTAPSPVRNSSGETVNDGLSRIAKVMAQAAQRDGGAKIAESLQSGLNIMGERLKVDGVVGPKTRAAIKDTIAENGSRQVAAAAALGRFKSFAKDAKASPKEASNLRAVVQSDIQPLLDNPSAPFDRHEAPKALQRGLNILNPLKQLKVDGDIGPKTTAAFQAALADADENAVTESIASSLGFRA